MRRFFLLVITFAAGLLFAVSWGGAAPRMLVPQHALCSTGFVDAVIGGEYKCLHAGEFCASRYETDYERYGFKCINGRLQEAAIPASSTTTTTTTTAAPLVVRPIKSLTPGAYNKAVSQKTINKTICVSGWTKKVRPPSSYTNALKLVQMMQYGETGLSSAYEEDHFIPLELGGAPRNPRNLWPEPRAESSKSDPLETKLKHKVCNGAVTLATARAQIRQFKNTHG